MAARRQTADAQEATTMAEARAAREKVRADNAQAQADAERAARERAEADARLAREQAEQATVITVQEAPPPPQQQSHPPQVSPDATAKEVRRQLLMHLNMAIVTRDTPRGLDATLNDPDFDHGQLRAGPAGGVSRIAAVLSAHPDLRVAVEGYSDTAEGSEMARQRAQSVAAALSAAGVPAARISCQSYGNSRPVVSNATEQGRLENRRVEIVITGGSIGNVPSWDRTYPLSFNRQ
jgi:outer membrane protein OmpA-like peptidoglycan-associated protein